MWRLCCQVSLGQYTQYTIIEKLLSGSVSVVPLWYHRVSTVSSASQYAFIVIHLLSFSVIMEGFSQPFIHNHSIPVWFSGDTCTVVVYNDPLKVGTHFMIVGTIIIKIWVLQ